MLLTAALEAPTNPRPAQSEEQQLRTRVQAEFQEMPGQRLTLRQACRLFGIDPTLCQLVLNGLVCDGHLATDGETYSRPPNVRSTRLFQTRR